MIVHNNTRSNISATAVKVQSELNINIGPAFDIQAVCAGFIYALNVGSSLLKTI